jgi:glyoxylase I family protein
MGKAGSNGAIGGGGFHHLAVRAVDYDKSIKFYTEALGFVRVYGWGSDEREAGGADKRVALLNSGDGNYIELFAGGKRAPGQETPEEPLMHVAFRSTDVKTAYDRAMAAGATSHIEPKTVTINGDNNPTDFTIAFVKGPDGEIIEFFDNEWL